MADGRSSFLVLQLFVKYNCESPESRTLSGLTSLLGKVISVQCLQVNCFHKTSKWTHHHRLAPCSWVTSSCRSLAQLQFVAVHGPCSEPHRSTSTSSFQTHSSSPISDSTLLGHRRPRSTLIHWTLYWWRILTEEPLSNEGLDPGFLLIYTPLRVHVQSVVHRLQRLKRAADRLYSTADQFKKTPVLIPAKKKHSYRTGISIIL